MNVILDLGVDYYSYIDSWAFGDAWEHINEVISPRFRFINLETKSARTI